MIPDFTEDGFLPPGVHRAALVEVEERFAGAYSSRQRRELFASIVELAKEAASTEFVERILLAGSFVTAKPDPNDFDCLIALRKTVVGRELRPFEYRLVSRRRARRAFDGDVLAFPADSAAFRGYFEFFQKNRDGTRVGMLEIEL